MSYEQQDLQTAINMAPANAHVVTTTWHPPSGRILREGTVLFVTALADSPNAYVYRVGGDPNLRFMTSKSNLEAHTIKPTTETDRKGNQ